MFDWLKNLYIVKLLFGQPEPPVKMIPPMPAVEKKKPGRRPGIKTRKTKTVKK